jgi:RimJ/RimL family protein N-acetyltransferase
VEADIALRPQRPGEPGEDWVVDSGFDDFGPRAHPVGPRPASLDDNGALVVTVDGKPVGTVSWIWRQWGPNAASRCLVVGAALFAGERGRGVGSAALEQLVDLAFRHTAVNRIEAHTDVLNVPAQRTLEGAGFEREGVVRGAQWRGGTYHDGILYSLLREEWEFRSRPRRGA